MSNPLDISHACRQSLQRASVAVGDKQLPPSHTLAQLLVAAGHLSELAHSSSAAPGACVTPLGPWCGHHPEQALTFLNTAALLPAASGEGAAASAAAALAGGGAGQAAALRTGSAPCAQLSPLDASRFDAALEGSVRAFASAASAVMKR
jgi:hypothetical protein